VKRDQAIINPGKPSVAPGGDEGKNEFVKEVRFNSIMLHRMILISGQPETSTSRSSPER